MPVGSTAKTKVYLMKLNCKSYVFVNPVESMQATLSASELNYIVPYAYGAQYAYGMPIRVWDRENAHTRTGYPIRVWDKIRIRDATQAKVISDYSRKITPMCCHAYRVNRVWEEAEYRWVNRLTIDPQTFCGLKEIELKTRKIQ